MMSGYISGFWRFEMAKIIPRCRRGQFQYAGGQCDNGVYLARGIEVEQRIQEDISQNI